MNPLEHFVLSRQRLRDELSREFYDHADTVDRLLQQEIEVMRQIHVNNNECVRNLGTVDSKSVDECIQANNVHMEECNYIAAEIRRVVERLGRMRLELIANHIRIRRDVDDIPRPP